MSDLIEVIQADVLEFRADVLALKYAQNYYGADQVVASLLINRGIVSADDIQPAPNSFRWVDTRGALPSSSVLFIGVPPLVNFSYLQIQEFTRRAILTTTRDRPDARHLVTTLHGPGIGLDEIEALHAEVRGIFSALNGHETAGSLVRISIVERNAERVKRLRAALFEAQQGAQILIGQYRTERKPRAFVAMPFSPDMEDVFYYESKIPFVSWDTSVSGSIRKPSPATSWTR